jgi:hypothetical protein
MNEDFMWGGLRTRLEGRLAAEARPAVRPEETRAVEPRLAPVRAAAAPARRSRGQVPLATAASR